MQSAVPPLSTIPISVRNSAVTSQVTIRGSVSTNSYQSVSRAPVSGLDAVTPQTVSPSAIGENTGSVELHPPLMKSSGRPSSPNPQLGSSSSVAPSGQSAQKDELIVTMYIPCAFTKPSITM